MPITDAQKALIEAASKPAERVRVYTTHELAILVLLATEACEPSVRGIFDALKQVTSKANISRWTQRLEKEGLVRRKAAWTRPSQSPVTLPAAVHPARA
jgi:hypothetical protein